MSVQLGRVPSVHRLCGILTHLSSTFVSMASSEPVGVIQRICAADGCVDFQCIVLDRRPSEEFAASFSINVFIQRCASIGVNPSWYRLVQHKANEQKYNSQQNRQDHERDEEVVQRKEERQTSACGALESCDVWSRPACPRRRRYWDQVLVHNLGVRSLTRLIAANGYNDHMAARSLSPGCPTYGAGDVELGTQVFKLGTRRFQLCLCSGSRLSVRFAASLAASASTRSAPASTRTARTSRRAASA